MGISMSQKFFMNIYAVHGTQNMGLGSVQEIMIITASHTQNHLFFSLTYFHPTGGEFKFLL